MKRTADYNINTSGYWDEVYRAEVATGRLRTDPMRLAELLRWIRIREDELQRPAAFLDVGCGPGDALIAVRRNRPGREAVGVDISPFAIDCVRGHGLEAHVVDVSASRVAAVFPHRFDIVWCGETIEHLEEPLKIIASFAGLVNPGGLVVLSTPYKAANPDPEHLWEFSFEDVYEWTQVLGGELLFYDCAILTGWLSMFAVVRVPAPSIT